MRVTAGVELRLTLTSAKYIECTWRSPKRGSGARVGFRPGDPVSSQNANGGALGKELYKYQILGQILFANTAKYFGCT